MAINWFPGHMNKAHREIKKAYSRVNFMIELLDARCPKSSENPLIAQLRGQKPSLIVLNKSDLADPKATKAWVEHFNHLDNVHAVSLDKGQVGKIKGLLKKGRRMLPSDRSKEKAIHVMIMGIPNVGKSTLINILAGRSIAKTGNIPAVTRRQQHIRLSHDMMLVDTPGFLWHKLTPKECGYRLAISGAVKDAVVDQIDIARFAAAYLSSQYPTALRNRYRIDELPKEPMELLKQIGAKRGCRLKGGEIDMQKSSEILIREYRSGKLGPISLEWPQS